MYQVVQFWKNICILLLFWAPHIGLFFSLPVTYILEGPGVSGCGWATFFNKEKKENERVWNILMNRIHSWRKENAVATKPKYKKTGPFFVSPMQWYISHCKNRRKLFFKMQNGKCRRHIPSPWSRFWFSDRRSWVHLVLPKSDMFNGQKNAYFVYWPPNSLPKFTITALFMCFIQ